jgi:hypothetical protein
VSTSTQTTATKYSRGRNLLIAAIALGLGLLAAIVLVQTQEPSTLVEPPPRETTPLPVEPEPRAPRPALEELNGPHGIHCVLPSGWRITQQTAVFVEARRSEDTFLRLGATRPSRMDLMTERLGEERTSRFHRLKLEKVSYRLTSAVLWEFEAGTRRIRVLNWRERDAEFFIYLSAPATSWSIPHDVAFQDLLTHTRVG